MTPTRPAAASGSYFPFLLLFLPLLCIVWAFWPTLIELSHVWSSDPQYSHGFLVPVFAVFLLWMRRDLLKENSKPASGWEAGKRTAKPTAAPSASSNALRPSWLGLPVLAAGIGLHLYAGYFGGYYAYSWLDAVAVVPCVAGLWITAGGRTGWRWGWPAIAFLLFLVPLPYRYAVMLSGPLRYFATISSTFVMQVIGLPALSEGNIISVNDAKIGVAEACSGLGMLVSFVALTTATVIIIRRPLLDKLIILASAVPIAIVSNIFRVTVTGVLHQTTTNEVANAWFHTVAGYMMPVLAIGLLWLELKTLSALFIDRPAPPPVRAAREPVVRRGTASPRTPWQRSATSITKEHERPTENPAEAVVAAKPGTAS